MKVLAQKNYRGGGGAKRPHPSQFMVKEITYEKNIKSILLKKSVLKLRTTMLIK